MDRVSKPLRCAVFVAFAFAIVGCNASRSSKPTDVPDKPDHVSVAQVAALSPGGTTPGQSGEQAVRALMEVLAIDPAHCEVTQPNGSTPAWERPGPNFLGNGLLWTNLRPLGILVF